MSKRRSLSGLNSPCEGKEVYSMKDIFINKKLWSKFSPIEMENFVNSVFYYYKEIRGFPYYPIHKEYRDKEFEKLKNYDRNKIIKNKKIKQTMHGLALSWSYMPHSFNVKCNDKMTPLEAFQDDAIFKRVIEKRIRIGDNMSDAGIRKMLRMFTGTQGVSNFRPTAVGAIYDRFAKNGTTLDMSMGYGGRLFGSIISNIDYIGTDPDTKTFKSLKNIKRDYGINNITLINKGSEDFVPDKNSIDFAFTSPPYFNVEKYSPESTQSYIKFPTINSWVSSFIGNTFDNVKHGLKYNGHMGINIANTRHIPNLEEKIIKQAKKSGFKLCDKLFYSLSRYKFGNKATYKFEPIYIFKRPS